MKAPEKIYGWLDSQLSVARFYGGITFQGQGYRIDMADKDQPLVRVDILEAEKKAAKNVAKNVAKKPENLTLAYFWEGEV
jgi:hypothetical protein